MSIGCPPFQRSISRRRFFEIGGSGLLGLTWADMFRAQAMASEGRQPTAKAKQVIFIFLAGGPPHQDMFDMKPDQPEEIRGPFKPIKSVLPGLDVSEHLPRLAKVADKYTLMRSVNAAGFPQAGNHFGGGTWKTGNRRDLQGTPKYPTYGNVTSKLLPTPPGLPSFVVMGKLDRMAPGLQENYLGPAYNHLDLSLTDETPERLSSNSKDGSALPDVTRLRLDPADLDRNAQLLQALEAQLRTQDEDPLLATLDRFQQKAFDLLRSPKLRNALDLSKESDEAKERYGLGIDYEREGKKGKKSEYGGNQSCQRVLAARRLIEAGVPFVHLDFGYWDFHGGVEKGGMEAFAMFDAALSSLVTDLEDRGLLETTMVVALGEMGRTPKINKNGPAARDHWASAQFIFAAGGGFQRGTVVGATDAQAAYVTDNEYKVTSLGRTIYHLLGIDPNHELYTTDNRPIRVIAEDAPLIREAMA